MRDTENQPEGLTMNKTQPNGFITYRAPSIKDRTAGKPKKAKKVKANQISMTLWGK